MYSPFMMPARVCPGRGGWLVCFLYLSWIISPLSEYVKNYFHFSVNFFRGRPGVRFC